MLASSSRCIVVRCVVCDVTPRDLRAPLVRRGWWTRYTLRSAHPRGEWAGNTATTTTGTGGAAEGWRTPPPAERKICKAASGALDVEGLKAVDGATDIETIGGGTAQTAESMGVREPRWFHLYFGGKTECGIGMRRVRPSF